MDVLVPLFWVPQLYFSDILPSASFHLSPLPPDSPLAFSFLFFPLLTPSQPLPLFPRSSRPAMLRSGSRVRRSVFHRGKAAAKFQFDIPVVSVTGLKEDNSFFVKWSRGVKVASTQPRAAYKGVAKKGGASVPFDEKLSLLCTLFRDGGIANSNSVEEKEAKLSLISITPGKKGSEKTVAKTHFNLASFAGVPSATERKVFSLSDKVFGDGSGRLQVP